MSKTWATLLALMGPLAALPALAVAPPEPPASLTLEAALDRALAHSPILLAARADVGRAEAEVGLARMAPLRSISANLGANSFAGAAPLTPVGGAVVTVNVGELLSTPYTLAGAQARLEATRQALRLSTLQVASNTTEAYTVWGLRRQMLALRQAAIRSSESELSMIERQFGKGNATVSDVLKLKLAASQTQSDLVAAEGDTKRAWVALLLQMGESAWLEAPSR